MSSGRAPKPRENHIDALSKVISWSFNVHTSRWSIIYCIDSFVGHIHVREVSNNAAIENGVIPLNGKAS